MAFYCNVAPTEGGPGVSGRALCDARLPVFSVGRRSSRWRGMRRKLGRGVRGLIVCSGDIVEAGSVGGPGTEYADGAVVKARPAALCELTHGPQR